MYAIVLGGEIFCRDRTAWQRPARILWTVDETGKAGEFSTSVYLHKDSNYGQGE